MKRSPVSVSSYQDHLEATALAATAEIDIPEVKRTLRMKRSPVSAMAARARLLVSAKCCPRSISRFLAAANVSLSSEDVRVVYLRKQRFWVRAACLKAKVRLPGCCKSVTL